MSVGAEGRNIWQRAFKSEGIMSKGLFSAPELFSLVASVCAIHTVGCPTPTYKMKADVLPNLEILSLIMLFQT